MTNQTKINSSDLKSALAQIKPFCSSKNESHKNVKIESNNGALRLSVANPFGGAQTEFPCNGDLVATVDLQKFMAVLSRVESDTLTIKEEPDALLIKSGKMRISLPIFNLPISVPPFDADISCTVDRKEWLDRSGRTSWLNSPGETRMAQAARVVDEGGALFIVSQTNHAWSCSNLEFKGEGLDAIVPHENMSSLNSALKNCDDDTVSFRQGTNQTTVSCGNFICVLKETEGQKPRMPSQVTPFVKDLEKWEVSREDVNGILNTISIFLTESATGLWLLPDEEGLHISFTGKADGTLEQDQAVQGRCASLAPGNCSGDKVYMSHKFLAPMVKNAASSEFLILSGPSHLAVSSNNFLAVASTMSEPQS